jgi:hypothetical protein
LCVTIEFDSSVNVTIEQKDQYNPHTNPTERKQSAPHDHEMVVSIHTFMYSKLFGHTVDGSSEIIENM